MHQGLSQATPPQNVRTFALRQRSRELRGANDAPAANSGAQLSDTRLPAYIPGIGFALFLVINATQIWGGIFPFLPQDFQTDQVTLAFYLAQSIALVATFFLGALVARRFARIARRASVLPATFCTFMGSALVISAMYAPDATLALVVAGGVFSGLGAGGFFLLWQRYFSSAGDTASNMGLMSGTALAAVLYYALHIIPIALTAFLLPVVLLPLSSLCLLLAQREMDLDQPMFQDDPRKHAPAYRRFVSDSWRAATGVAAIGFVCGLSRGVSVTVPEVGAVVNIASMAGSLVGALTFYILSRKVSLSFGLTGVFRFLYPIIVVGLLVSPFAHERGTTLFAGLTYMAFSLVVLVMMMQCAQTSRARGINPFYVYGLFAICAYASQAIGFVLGWVSAAATSFGVERAAFLSLLAAFVMGMALFLTSRPATETADGVPHEDKVELLHPENPDVTLIGKGVNASARGLTDRISKQCYVLRTQYGLSAREAEVMECIARGMSVSAISERLFISENTVRTHSKHIYTKLGIHSKQELSEMLDDIDFSELGATVI